MIIKFTVQDAQLGLINKQYHAGSLTEAIGFLSEDHEVSKIFSCTMKSSNGLNLKRAEKDSNNNSLAL